MADLPQATPRPIRPRTICLPHRPIRRPPTAHRGKRILVRITEAVPNLRLLQLTAAAATAARPTPVAMAAIRRVPRMLQVAEMVALLTAVDWAYSRWRS